MYEERKNAFIEKAKKKYGDKFDYSKVVYKDSKTPVIISCPIHGDFTIRPNTYLSGVKHGCPKCGYEIGGKNIRVKPEEKLKRLKQVHGDKYDYSKADLTSKTHDKITIICPKHGEYNQTYTAHIQGQGCPVCSIEIIRNKQAFTTEQIVQKFKDIHGDEYDYSLVKYINLESKVKIICKIHGVFEQTPHVHIYQKSKCPKCAIKIRANNKRMSLETFISKAKVIHNNKYDYSMVKLSNTLKEDVTIICPEHGEYEQSPDKHLQGRTCPKCAGKYQMSKDEWFAKAKELHGNIYDYSKTIYPPVNEDVIITCKKHGDYNIPARKHVHPDMMQGCPVCNSSKGEKVIFNKLQDMNIEFIREYSIPGHNYRYDFYLPQLNILIEYDGIQHYKPIKQFGGEKAYLELLERDKAKTELAKYKNYILIRIPYTFFKSLREYLVKKISDYYKYRIDDKFYRNFLELCRGEHLDGNTTPNDVEQYLLFKK